MGSEGSRALTISVEQGSLLDVDTQVIVNAANSHGLMGGGVAGIIRRVAGFQVEEEARRQAPIPVGMAVLTSGGRTKFRGIIHAPTMPEPAMRIPPYNVGVATRAALALADEQGFHSMALPGLGTGVGKVSHQEAAREMIQEIQQFNPEMLQVVVLIDIDPVMVQAWRDLLFQQGNSSGG
jgi:O-acetyl-ADP-ribose deacetylase (regulator of RNase III)